MLPAQSVLRDRPTRDRPARETGADGIKANLLPSLISLGERSQIAAVYLASCPDRARQSYDANHHRSLEFATRQSPIGIAKRRAVKVDHCFGDATENPLWPGTFNKLIWVS